MIDVRSLQLDQQRRQIFISDIHASLDLLKKLLRKVNYTYEDYLFINGDLCDKGKNSLEVIHFVRELTLKSDRVFVTKGNCDILHRYVYEGHEGIYDYMKNRKETLLNEMLEIHGKTLDDFSHIKGLSEFYYQNFKEELEWLDSLPVGYETDEFLMIHAGINRTLEQTDQTTALQIPSFYEKGHSEDKVIIVGHWPVVNYRFNNVCSNNPMIDFDKRIIAIDGGNTVKRDGQLNALIVENKDYSYTYVDSLTDKSYIKTDYTPPEDVVGTVSYPYYEVTILQENEYFTLCKNDQLNVEQWIKNEYLSSRNGNKATSKSVSTTLLSVKAKEEVYLLDDKCEGYSLVKKQSGEIGWVPKDYLEIRL
ncbi:metallophosphoesterase [Piscibacillus halophilus]|uniref:Protein phosphatase n=1 Tax=Piscibacillus halophilus TaxID=571933 RepID=A0A1H8YTT1_9BACI|nr:metallophosphoesterase [Piscibacillus halophilus]SEP55615.1 protein phosphatase [Piscibacillus halophilus]